MLTIQVGSPAALVVADCASHVACMRSAAIPVPVLTSPATASFSEILLVTEENQRETFAGCRIVSRLFNACASVRAPPPASGARHGHRERCGLDREHGSVGEAEAEAEGKVEVVEAKAEVEVGVEVGVEVEVEVEAKVKAESQRVYPDAPPTPVAR
ncbi:hypothetical protein [Burkholderia sp. Nafp2/4-1b]|uniref:hypothetical protein n=1 Tax=Burkholderia sp. Nafp2/4-1b TaxID=2116686 RepID=UPI0013CECD3E|nr:hypothetical protein [Burkholderia sp. Nafp2/4-1b]